ncbi:MAG: PAS domain-containing sensor histidine kinase [Alphaproteobacteria bacterium]|nr:MAG: PAS domain-containing sensor histidine kinase [Alphaproteobacteria bacterium]
MLQEIVNNANMGFVVVGPKLDVRLWNKWMVQVTGIEAEVAYCRNLPDLLPGFNSKALLDRVERALQEGMSSTLAPHETKDIVPVSAMEIMVQPLRSKHHLHALKPVSEMMADALCLIQFKSRGAAVVPQAAVAAPMEGAGATPEAHHARLQFLATVSHQIRTPVNGVLGVAELLASTPLSPEQRKYVDLIAKSGQALLNFINEMAELSHLEAGLVELETRAADLPELMQDVVDLFATAGSHKGVKAFVDLAPDLPRHVRTDPQKVRQILVNLLSNAFKYTDRGRVSLEVHTSESDGQTILHMSVSDTGVGIPKERIGGLFEKLAMDVKGGTRLYNRTGLGLFLCKELVDLFGGEISVRSTLGQGSTFTVRLPVEVVEKDDIAPEEQPLRIRASDSGPWQVLVAEDNPVNQMLFRKSLEQQGHKVTVVGNGQEAVTAVQVREPYDIILMDITMPVMDGLEATALIRSLAGPQGQTPILALTAHAMDGDREKFLDAGMDGYQSKPVDPAALMDAMAKVILQHRQNLRGTATTAPGQSERRGNGQGNWPRSQGPDPQHGNDRADR